MDFLTVLAVAAGLISLLVSLYAVVKAQEAIAFRRSWPRLTRHGNGSLTWQAAPDGPLLPMLEVATREGPLPKSQELLKSSEHIDKHGRMIPVGGRIAIANGEGFGSLGRVLRLKWEPGHGFERWRAVVVVQLENGCQIWKYPQELVLEDPRPSEQGVAGGGTPSASAKK